MFFIRPLTNKDQSGGSGAEKFSDLYVNGSHIFFGILDNLNGLEELHILKALDNFKIFDNLKMLNSLDVLVL